MKKRIRAFGYALRGIALGFRQEAHMKIHAAVALLVIAAAYILKISRQEWMIVFICISLVISAELFNAAIERLANRITLEKDPLIGAAKDLAAGSVLVAAIISVICGCIIFIPYLSELVL